MTHARAEELLTELWQRLRDGFDKEAVGRAQGAIHMARHVGALDNDAEDLWLLRIQRCPGHGDEGGRDWCAYCGNMPPEPTP